MVLAAGAFFALPLLGIFLQGDLSHGIHSSVGQTALRVAAEELANKYPAADLLGIYLAAL